MKVWSLVTKPGEPRHSQALTTDYGFWQRGYEVVPFSREQLLAGELDRDLLNDPENTLVHASVLVAREALHRAGRPEPPNIDFPDALRNYVGRRIRETTMSDIRRWERTGSAELPAHVKPRDQHKLFTGTVVRGFRDLIPLANVAAEEPVFAQEIVEFVSEWRATILRGKLLNVAHYKGDPLRFPDPSTMAEALTRFDGPPIGFAMDWGIVADGRTLLVEVNDGFALGNYGVRGFQYTALLECRWRELMGLSDNGVGEEP